MNNKILLSVLMIMLFSFSVEAQNKTKRPNKSFYFAWGYNKEWYTKSTVHVEQNELGNNYSLNNVEAHDNPGWTTGIFNKAISIPQYNYRIGYMFNEDKGWGVEINFDHTKYIIKEPQQVNITGTFNNQPLDTTVNFESSNGFYYYLNNGANFFLINLVKRWQFYADAKKNFQVDAFGKFGVGPVVPHVQNSFFGMDNDPHFQIGGWNTGLEAAIRLTVKKHVFFEFANKLDYARYSNLKIYKGTAKQAFGTYEMIFCVGVTIPSAAKEIVQE